MSCKFPGDDWCFENCEFFQEARKPDLMEKIGREQDGCAMRFECWRKDGAEHLWLIKFNLGGWKRGTSVFGKGDTFREAMEEAWGKMVKLEQDDEQNDEVTDES